MTLLVKIGGQCRHILGLRKRRRAVQMIGVSNAFKVCCGVHPRVSLELAAM